FSRSVLGNPPLFKRSAKTEVVVREGDSLVIGGIQIENANNTRRQVPLLGDIPVLGWLFKSREISLEVNDLIIILTPTVVAQAGTAVRRWLLGVRGVFQPRGLAVRPHARSSFPAPLQGASRDPRNAP